MPRNSVDPASSDPSRSSQSRCSLDLVSPSEIEWVRWKDVINELYDSMTLSEMMTKMDEWYGFRATKRQYTKHLTEWDIGKYMSWEEREALCKRLLSDHVNGRHPSYMTSEKVKKLLRHCREASDPPGETILGILRDLEKSTLSSPVYQGLLPGPSAMSLAALESPVQHEDMIDTMSAAITAQSHSWLPESFSQFNSMWPPESELSTTRATTALNSTDRTQTLSGANEKFSCSLQELIQQQQRFNVTAGTIPRHLFGAGDRDDAMELLVWSSSRYYDAKIQEYLLRQTSTRADLHGGHALDKHTLLQAKDLWTKVKSGIYYLKMRDEQLAQPLFEEAKALIPQLCKLEPLTMLRELFATLSFSNTRIKPSIRADMLDVFARSTIDGHDDSFGSICRQLSGPWMTDEALVNALICISKVTMAKLPAEHLEVYELRRTLIRLLRRRMEFGLAEKFAHDMIADAERQWGLCSETARLARTELLYILNDLGHHERALVFAEDIVNRTRQDEGSRYPSKRAMYAMEDVAEICTKLGRRKDAGIWLNRALTGAQTFVGEHQWVAHIGRKLEALEEVGELG